MKLDELEFFSLDSTKGAKSITVAIDKQIKANKKRIPILVDDSPAYPNACVPISGVIDYYKRKGIKIELSFFGNPDSYVSTVNIENPYAVEDENNKRFLDYPFDKIWTFESLEGENALVSAFVLSLRRMDVCGSGVFTALEWCLNEVLDNVLIHSEANKGFVMAQYHPSNKLFSVSVFDYGIGIYNSFKNSKHRPRGKGDAITLAIKEKVTRDDKIGQGNGLWGLHQIVEEDGGTLTIISDGAYYQTGIDEDGKRNTFVHDKGNTFIFKENVGTTFVDFQMNTGSNIDVGKALNSFDVMNLWEDNLENEGGDYLIDVFSMSQGTGTRPAALQLKNIILNLAINEKKKVILDFSNVSTLGSSYADELIGKIISEYGIVFFNHKFEMRNISKSNASILERSVKLRMAQSYYDEALNEEY